MFDSLNLCINYVKVLDIKKDSACAVLEKRNESNGVFIPSYLTENSRPFFAIDNTNIKIDAPFRKASTSWGSNGSISTKFTTKGKNC